MLSLGGRGVLGGDGVRGKVMGSQFLHSWTSLLGYATLHYATLG